MNDSIRPAFDRRDYRKSSFSSGEDPQCVEVALRDNWAGLRDSKSASDVGLVVPAAEFDRLVASLRSGMLH